MRIHGDRGGTQTEARGHGSEKTGLDWLWALLRWGMCDVVLTKSIKESLSCPAMQASGLVKANFDANQSQEHTRGSHRTQAGSGKSKGVDWK